MIRQNVPLGPLTTLRVGGSAAHYAHITSLTELHDVLIMARPKSFAILGGGSNTLVSDEGIDGLVIHQGMTGISHNEEGNRVRVVAGAGTPWEELVTYATDHGWFGVENLAGIPGTVGGAAVQNIGAYGMELSNSFAYAVCINLSTGQEVRIEKEEAQFAYRQSTFKQRPELLILRVALDVKKRGTLITSYQDIARLSESRQLTSSKDVANAVREIRAAKFPDLTKEGTAGSFFKNPVVLQVEADHLRARFPELPIYPAGELAKVSAAWLIDHVLKMRGYRLGKARLFERQPLVLVTEAEARASDVEALATFVTEKMHDACGITLEREVVSMK